MKSEALRSPAEIAEVIRGLTLADWIRLRRVAAAYSRNRPIEEEDLLQEALRRSLDGNRNCPAHIDVVRFLAEAMRSIAHDSKVSASKQPSLVHIANHGAAEGAVDPPDPAPCAEQNLESKQEAIIRKAAVLALFDDDEIAQVILEGMMEGMSGETLRELTDLDKTAYESKRKLIRRRIDKKSTRGWTL